MSTNTPKKTPEENTQAGSNSSGTLLAGDANTTAQCGSVEVEVQAEPSEVPEEKQAITGRKPSREQLIDIVQKLREEAKASRERMLRVAADADNLRKRVLKERKDIEKFNQENLLRDLLVPLDNLERTLEHIPESEENLALNTLREGLEMVLHQFWSALAGHNLNRLDASKGESFDPTRHEALNRKETDEVPPGTVLSVLQRGYQLHERLLRPVMVEVACAPEMSAENEQACSDQDQTTLQHDTPKEE